MADTTCAADLTLAYAMFPDCTRSGCGLCDGLMDVTGTAATETDLCTILTSLYGSGAPHALQVQNSDIAGSYQSGVRHSTAKR